MTEVLVTASVNIDPLYDVLLLFTNRLYTSSELISVWNTLPKTIKFEAMRGINADVSKLIFEHFKQNGVPDVKTS